MNSTGTVLIICHGNTHRSPSTEIILRESGVPCHSAGMKISAGCMSKKMRRAMIAYGYSKEMVEAHRPKEVSAAMLEEAKLVVYMDRGNLQRLQERFHKRYWHKFACLAEWFPGDYRLKSIRDPAYLNKGTKGLEKVIGELVLSSQALASHIKSKHNTQK